MAHEPTQFARALRHNQTDTERELWHLLRGRDLAGFKFRRQVPLGEYVADFVCWSARLIVELDGGQHLDRADHDARKTAWLESQNFRVLRFWNNDVFGQREAVLQRILSSLHTPHPNPLLYGLPPKGKRLIDSVGVTEVLAVARLRKCAGN